MIAFNGVLISWLMPEKNSFLSSLVSVAATSFSSCSFDFKAAWSAMDFCLLREDVSTIIITSKIIINIAVTAK